MNEQVKLAKSEEQPIRKYRRAFTSTGLEVKDTDIERLERTYQGKGLFINAVPLYL